MYEVCSGDGLPGCEMMPAGARLRPLAECKAARSTPRKIVRAYERAQVERLLCSL